MRTRPVGPCMIVQLGGQFADAGTTQLAAEQVENARVILAAAKALWDGFRLTPMMK